MTEKILLAIVAGLLLRFLVAILRPVLNPHGQRLALRLARALVRLDPRREDLLAEVAWMQTQKDRSGLPEVCWGLLLIGGRVLVEGTAARIRALFHRLAAMWGWTKARITKVSSKELTDAVPEPYTHTNSKGVTYVLNQKSVVRGGRSQRIHYFSKDVREDSIGEMPDAFTVIENPRNGFLLLERRL